MKVPFKVIGFASTGTTIDFIEVGPYGPWIVSGWIQWPLLDLIKPAYESLTVSTIVPTELSVSISPLSASILVGQSVTFTSTVSGGYTPYSYQWYLNDNPVSGATSDTWIFTPTTRGIYYVHLRVTDAKANTAQSDSARITTATVPVGGYSIPIQAPAVAKPLTPYLILTAILTIAFTTIKHKTKRKTKKPQ
jgi:PKD repeat protein